MQHIVLFSGGLGSFAASIRVKEQYGVDKLTLLFTDTRSEDPDLYRFLLEAVAYIEGVGVPRQLIDKVTDLPLPGDLRNQVLAEVQEAANAYFKCLVWLADGRDVWQVFQDERFIGNSRVDPCSRVLKREIAHKWIKTRYEPEEATVYLGIDWTEIHRYERAVPHWKPYQIEAPLCEQLGNYKDWLKPLMSENNIEIPRLYKLGFAHNNCGGFCVKAGLGHFKQLLEKLPEVYEYHEAKEKETQDLINKPATILRLQRKPKNVPISLEEFRVKQQSVVQLSLDLDGIGGCGCMLG